MRPDLLVIGGGAIGLSIAWCAARRGARVRVLERGAFGRESSWAAAGILPFSRPERATSPYARAMAESWALHAEHAERLRAETGLDVGHRVCGEILAAFDEAEQRELEVEAARQRAGGATLEAGHEPALSPAALAAIWVRETAQVRPPRYLRALEEACRGRGVELIAPAPVASLIVEGARALGARTEDGTDHLAGATVLAAGAWTPALEPGLDVRPLRGQLALLDLGAPLFTPIISVGHEYLVPRDDGLVLVGATIEDVGFDARTTASGVRRLLDVAVRMVPELARATVVHTWAGLRPATPSGEPYVGRGSREGLWIAAGHTRQGIHLAPHTGETIARDALGA